jgi:dTDP-4-amino-4,6-dideoxygalactose transaminase
MIPYGRQTLDDNDIQAVTDVLKGDWLTTGPTVHAFEAAVAERVGVKYAVAVANGTVALHLAVLALGLPQGFLGITSPLTFAASANAIVYAGGSLDLVDIDPSHPGMSLEGLDRFCSSGLTPKVVIPVSYAGLCPDLPGLRKLSQQYGFFLIEDASHSLGTSFLHDGHRYQSGDCSFTDLATLSFHPVKNITCAEGGMILTNNPMLYERLLPLRNHGMEKNPKLLTHQNPPGWLYEIQSLGFNGRLSDVHAALGFSQLKKLDSFKIRRQELAHRYDQALSDIEEFKTLKDLTLPFDDTEPFLHIYPLRLKDPSSRDPLYTFLHSKKILAQVHYLPIHHHPHFQKLLPEGRSFPVADQFFSSELSIPLFPSMTNQEQEQVITFLLEFIST